MLVHLVDDSVKKGGCLTPLEIDLTEGFHITSSVQITKEGLLPLGFSLKQKSEIDAEPMFYCPSCEKEVPIEEIGLECSHCYEYFPITEMSLLEKGGGVHCKASISRLEKGELGEILPAISVINTIKLMM